MNRTYTSQLVRVGAALAATVALGSLAACGGSDANTDTPKAAALPEKVDDIAALVPAAIAEKGTLVVAAATYPPAVIEPVDGGEVTGWDIENARQIAAVLGLKVDVQIVDFDGVVPGLQAGRYDAATGEIYVTPERTEVVTFVTNHRSQDALMVPADSEIDSAMERTDLCGLTLAASTGSAEADLVREIATECEEAGEGAVTLKTFGAQADVNLALSEGRVDAAVSSASQVAYVLSQTEGKFDLVELPWAEGYDTGLALARNDDTPEMAKAVEAATDHLIENGTLQDILDKWNDGQGGIDDAQIVGE